MKKLTLSLFCLIASLAGAEEQSSTPATDKATPAPKNAFDVAKVSQAFGHLIGKNLDSMGVKFDIAQVIKGLQDASEGGTAPMTEMECVQAITAVQEAAFKEISSENLQKADAFLAQNSSADGVKVLESGKLQYRIEKEGTGPVVDSHSSPLIRYTGKFLDGNVFDASKEEEMINLDETIPGFSQGIVGMKEGEKRTLYIHPEMGYGTSGYLPPNSLLTFEIEVVKAHAPHAETLDSLSTTTPKTKGNPEIALPFEEPKAVR